MDEWDNLQYERKVKVVCSVCKGWFNEEDVEFIQIEENMQGQDLLTFMCPVCNKPAKSLRLG
jgi:hypothetical protein